jgi:NitT/TauT family transport system substrate-binding protein
VDAIIMYSSSTQAVNRVLHSAAKTAKSIPWADYGLAGYANSVVASKRFLAEKREVVVRFVRALQKAEQLMQHDPERAALAVKASVPEIDPELVEATVRDASPAFFNDITTRDGLGVFSPALVRTTWEWVAKEEGVPVDKLDPLASIDFAIAK